MNTDIVWPSSLQYFMVLQVYDTKNGKKINDIEFQAVLLINKLQHLSYILLST